MRFVSPSVGGIRIFAVAGTNTVSFAVDAEPASRPGLLGFAVERVDPAKSERYYLPGFKVFRSVIPHPDEHTSVSTFEQPVQSFVWDDFTATPDHSYTYVFHPLKGKPKDLDRSTPAVSIDVTTEPLYGKTHDVFFNRGVASSQAYAKRFNNVPPDQITSPLRRKEALNWLSRDLDDALIRFIRSARRGNLLRGAFYEFDYAPVLDEFAKAIARGVDVQLVVDEKPNKPRFPLDENLNAISAAGLGGAVTPRTARASSIAHNKFLVLSTGRPSKPTAVWTGSTNLTNGGIHGQANIGHWIRDAAAAATYQRYWDLLFGDPGGLTTDSRTAVIAKNKRYLADVEALTPTPAIDDIPVGVTPIFSPRHGDEPLDLYAQLIVGASDLACATFAFTIDARFKTRLAANTAKGPLVFLLLEKKDVPSATSKTPFVRLNSRNNVYEASGSDIATPLGQWVQETDNKRLGLNTHVVYMHCKFLLRDPLGADPIVVTGSANFSDASTTSNDENMVVIRGDRRVADIYFTEFNRLFNHYYARSVLERVGTTDTSSWDLDETDAWLQKYEPGTLRSKRVEIFTTMAV